MGDHELNGAPARGERGLISLIAEGLTAIRVALIVKHCDYSAVIRD